MKEILEFLKFKNKRIILYVDPKNIIANSLYEKLGFKFIHNTPPNFYYVINKKRINRLNFQKHKLVKMGYDKNKTANQIMIDENINKIYDCGNKKYIKH
jgi:ribosomal protein S18 acetylase RimI-like enzyme